MEFNNNLIKLTGGRLLARNAALNIAGQIVPLAVAVITIPILIRKLGTERFGVLTLAWMMIGYFSLFDLGIGRALTRSIAEKLGASKEEEIPALIWTGLLVTSMMGLIGAILFSALSPWLVSNILKIPHGLQVEALQTFFLLAITIPVVILIIGLRGVLEAHQRFGIINAIRINMGALTFLGPLLALQFSQSLLAVVAVLAVGRGLECILNVLICGRLMPQLWQGKVIQWNAIGPLFQFGGWVTISNVLSPIMVYFDRFFIGMLISMAAVTYYVTPYEVVTKLWFIPGAMAAVLFPSFSASFTQDPSRTLKLFMRGAKYIYLILFPITLLITCLGQEGLNLWVGKEFANQSTRVLQWLAVGVFVNSLANIPFALVQSSGRPDLAAKLHLLELPFYLIAVWYMINTYGIEGAAIVWFVRALVDSLMLFRIAGWILPKARHFIQEMTMMMCVGALILAFPMLRMNGFNSGVFLFMILIIFVLFAWFFMLEPAERIFAQNIFKARRSLR
jgi:O-antigen/teichoic acid export membrane protein